MVTYRPKIPSIGRDLCGRAVIYTAADEINRENVLEEYAKAFSVHQFNRSRIEYLYGYVRGITPILKRQKLVRSDICSRINENHALEVSQFTANYFAGEPITYVRRGEKEQNSKDIELLNNYMYFEGKQTCDAEIAHWMADVGVGYRMVLPDKYFTPDMRDESPFEIDALDPAHSFVVYNSGFGNEPMMGVHLVVRKDADGHDSEYANVYTKDRYFLIHGNEILMEKPHALGDVPIIEYQLNNYRMGSFEPAIPLLDAINNITSNRCDGVEQIIQSFLKFINCDIDADGLQKLQQMGAISIKSMSGLNADVDTIRQDLDQTQVQTLIDYLYHQVLTICGVPNVEQTEGSTSDNGNAVLLRAGWLHAESRAKSAENYWRKSDKRFLKIVLKILRDSSVGFDLSLSEIECKFTRRQHDNLLTKTQSLLHMLEAGLAPEVAIATCGLFNDPMDVAQQSEEYLEKWVYEPTSTETAASGFLGNVLNDGKQDTDELIDQHTNGDVSERTGTGGRKNG